MFDLLKQTIFHWNFQSTRFNWSISILIFLSFFFFNNVINQWNKISDQSWPIRVNIKINMDASTRIVYIITKNSLSHYISLLRMYQLSKSSLFLTLNVQSTLEWILNDAKNNSPRRSQLSLKHYYMNIYIYVYTTQTWIYIQIIYVTCACFSSLN